MPRGLPELALKKRSRIVRARAKRNQEQVVEILEILVRKTGDSRTAKTDWHPFPPSAISSVNKARISVHDMFSSRGAGAQVGPPFVGG
jgi:hypothetical protein